MAVFKCSQCGEIMESRCKPGKCKSCGAPKEDLQKQEQPKKK
ncbi:MAG: RCKP-type rubredoxin-like domain-containing protein [Desulfurispora sp.]